MGIHARLIGHQTDAAAAHDRQAVAEQDVDPRPHRAGHRRLGHGAARAAAQRPSAESQHDESSVHSKHLALVVILVAACGPAPATVAPIPTSRAVGPETDVATLLAGMSVRDKIAQLVMPWMPGTYAAYDDDGFARAAALGRLTARRRHHRLGRLAARRRGQAQPAAAALRAAAARRVRLRGRHQPPAQRRNAVPSQYGRGRHRERQRRLRHRAHHRARGARGRRAARLRAGGRRQQQPRQPDHQHPLVRRGPGRGGPPGRGRGARPAGQRHARDRQALSRPRRHRHRLAPGAARHCLRLAAARLGRAGAVPRRHRGRRGRGHVGPHRTAGIGRGAARARAPWRPTS